MPLIYNKNVIRTDITDRVIAKLQPVFEREKINAWITSVQRTKESQLAIIQSYASKHNVTRQQLNFVDTQIFNGQSFPVWQVVWSTLLHLGIIISPPLPAEVLMDYIRDGKNKKGKTLSPSPHLLTPSKSFDIAGFEDIDRCYEVMNSAKTDCGIRNVLIERANNCIHSDCL